MKKIALLMAVAAMALSVTSCGKKCATCGKSHMFGNKEILGQTVCSDCIKSMNSLLGM